MKTILKIVLLIVLGLAVYLGVRFVSGDQGFVAALDKWLDQFQEQSLEIDHIDESEEEEGDDDDDDVPSRVEIYNGLPAVRLKEEVITRSGIRIESLKSTSYSHEHRAVGRVIGFQSLLQKQAEFKQSKSELLIAQESLNATAKVYERLRLLNKERANVSLRQVEEARLPLLKSKAKVAAIKQKIQALQTQTVHEWGGILANWALAPNVENADYFDRLLLGQDVLLLVTLPSDTLRSKDNSQVYINSISDRSTAQKAQLISTAAYTDTTIQGVTYYFRTAAKNMRINMRLNVWMVSPDENEKGVSIPLAAIIWYAGQPWVYVKVTDELYSRRPVLNYRETDQGWFINHDPNNTFDLNEKIVVQGGQLLLSEELRWQIPDEDDD
ncbi:MAG: hypothetical protein AB8D52_02520 [Gammaproteobacteria bacterium]